MVCPVTTARGSRDAMRTHGTPGTGVEARGAPAPPTGTHHAPRTEVRIPKRTRPTATVPDIKGRWRKTSDSDAFREYPAEISFAADTYRTAKAPGQMMIWWDAGIYRVQDAHTVVISTATDEMVEYAMRVDGNRLRIDIPKSGTITYERMEDTR